MVLDINKLEFKKDETALTHFDLFTLFPRLSKIVNSKHFAFDLRKLESGKFSFPYHFHRNSEEVFLVLSGSMIIRTPEGFENISQGNLAFFEIGKKGAHQFYNSGPDPCLYFDLRSTIGMDVSEFVDSGKIFISPFNDEIFELSNKVTYNKGEENADKKWKKEWEDFISKNQIK